MDLDDLPASSMVGVFSMYPKVLVFHAFGEHGRCDDRAMFVGANRWEVRMECGRLASWQEWVAHSAEVRSFSIALTYMRLDHARMIGRPCQRCYPSTKC